MHVDGERDAAEADKRNTQFLLTQRSTPKCLFPKLLRHVCSEPGNQRDTAAHYPQTPNRDSRMPDRHPLFARPPGDAFIRPTTAASVPILKFASFCGTLV